MGLAEAHKVCACMLVASLALLYECLQRLGGELIELGPVSSQRNPQSDLQESVEYLSTT